MKNHPGNIEEADDQPVLGGMIRQSLSLKDCAHAMFLTAENRAGVHNATDYLAIEFAWSCQVK